MSSEVLPEVKVLHSFEVASVSAERFEYPNIDGHLKLQQQYVADRWHKTEEAAPNSVQHEDVARSLAIFYLIKTGKKLECSDNSVSEDIWATRFTHASKELYGKPDETEVIKIALNTLNELQSYQDNSSVDQQLLAHVTGIYKTIVKQPLDELPTLDADKQLRKEGKDFLYGAHSDLLGIVNTEATYGPQEMLAAFEKALTLLRSKNSSWEGWKVESRGTNNIKVDADKHTIIVGTNRKDEKGKKFQAIFAHELLVHATRRVNAEKYDDVMLQRGLPNYLDAEEGLGIFTEYLLTGELSNKNRDRYVDIALALGDDTRKPLTRSELLQLAREREIIRKQAKNEAIDHEEIYSSSQQYVYRIFRGGTGKDAAGVPAIFTRDIVYYQGFAKNKRLFEQQRALGKSIAQIYEYLLAGKFDPTNPTHQNHIAKYGIML